MNICMIYRKWRAQRRLARFFRYVDLTAIERRNPRAFKAIKSRVGWRLLAKDGRGRT